MSKEDLIEFEGTVVEVLAGSWFKVKLDDGDNHVILAYLGGKIRQNRIRVILGDRVLVGLSPYDPSKGKIIFRNKF